MESGLGALLTDVDGNTYLDFVAGIGVVALPLRRGCACLSELPTTHRVLRSVKPSCIREEQRPLRVLSDLLERTRESSRFCRFGGLFTARLRESSG